MSTLQYVFVLIASALILFWLLFALAGPRTIDVPNVRCVLRYGSALRIAALVFAWTPPSLLIYVVVTYVWRNEEALMLAGISFLATSAVASLLLIEVERMQILLSENGIMRHSPWTGRGEMKWSEVESIEYSPLNRWFVVTGSGRRVRISRHLVGVGEFVRLARMKLAPERYSSVMAVFNRLDRDEPRTK